VYAEDSSCLHGLRGWREAEKSVPVFPWALQCYQESSGLLLPTATSISRIENQFKKQERKKKKDR